VKVKAEGEVSDLAGSLNEIIARIKSETSALEKSQLELGSANTRLLESYSKIQEANEKLKKMDQMKSDFVANVAHELLNPLATIRETMEILRTNLDPKMDAKQREVWEISKRNIVRLIRLVQDILDVSRIEAGKMELTIRPVEVADMVEEILIPLEILFKKKNIVFSKKVQPGLTRITADRDKLIQAVTNLLMNAAKYTPDGGTVVFSLLSGKEGVLVEVRDSGPGIDVKDQEKLFSKFERISVDKKEGTGLGLTITKDIVSLHKGKIWVESEAGKGAAFKFILPQ
jgi:signal transduction histidine kinase